VVSPFGARGGNSGVRDAACLSWKLALHILGKADESLLDTHEEERRISVSHDVVENRITSSFMIPSQEICFLREAILDIAVDHPEVRGFINSGRFAEPPVPFVGSSLLTAGRGKWSPKSVDVGHYFKDTKLEIIQRNLQEKEEPETEDNTKELSEHTKYIIKESFLLTELDTFFTFLVFFDVQQTDKFEEITQLLSEVIAQCECVTVIVVLNKLDVKQLSECTGLVDDLYSIHSEKIKVALENECLNESYFGINGQDECGEKDFSRVYLIRPDMYIATRMINPQPIFLIQAYQAALCSNPTAWRLQSKDERLEYYLRNSIVVSLQKEIKLDKHIQREDQLYCVLVSSLCDLDVNGQTVLLYKLLVTFQKQAKSVGMDVSRMEALDRSELAKKLFLFLAKTTITYKKLQKKINKIKQSASVIHGQIKLKNERREFLSSTIN